MSVEGPQDLVSLVYTSTAAHPLRETALEDLLVVSREGNASRAVTGMLLYRDGRFIQVLEGTRETVEQLVKRIERDTRHHDMRILLNETIDGRRFGEWTMGYRVLRTGPEALPRGFRDSFEDLDAGADTATTLRALAELTLWFRVRTAPPVAASTGF